MKVMITGGDGQLGKGLSKVFKQDAEVLLLNKESLDITNELAVREVINRFKPHYIMNAAAYTKVDLAENEREQAFSVNALGPYYLAKAASEVGAVLFYISSDYVFDGASSVPYEETDRPNPTSIYGQSKWLGEQLVTMISEKVYIVRTSWLYGGEGNNHFVSKILNQLKLNQELRVVDDQIGSPTYVEDLALTIKSLIGKPYGIYHVTNSGSCSWFEFAQKIAELSGYQSANIQPISSSQLKTLANRPMYSVLSHNALHREGIKMKPWHEALQHYFYRKETFI